MQSTSTYLTTSELSKLIKYDCRTIREQLKDSVLLEGIHYIRPFGGRKILYDWGAIQRDMCKFSLQARQFQCQMEVFVMGSINSRGSGKLYLDFRYRNQRCREQTELKDTPANRKKLQKLLDNIEAEILLGCFDYAKTFPNSPRLKKID